MKERDTLSPEFYEKLPLATENYMDSLRLPEGGSVLFITDRFVANEKDVAARRALTLSLKELARSNGHETHTIEFDNEMAKEAIHQQTQYALGLLEEKDDSVERITVVYIGDQWQGRYGMYNAVGEHSTQVREARIAISPQANVDDILFMSELAPQKIEQIGKGIDYFEGFFEEHPKGTFVIKTEKDGVEGKLTVKYDTSKAEFDHDRGILDDNKPCTTTTETDPIFNGVNPLGTESYGTPYPFESTQGTFVTNEGIKFTIVDGFYVAVENWEEAYDSLEDKQKQLIDILKERVRLQEEGCEYEYMKVAFSEFGLGGFRIAGIEDVPEGCTSLIKEKLGPHGGGGMSPSETIEEKALNEAASKVGFTHTDFVMSSNTVITFISDDGEESQFYPPI